MNHRLESELNAAGHLGWRAGRRSGGELLFGALLVGCFAAIFGCSRDSSRLAVEGEVTIDGNPLPNGKISFMPMPGTSSPTAGATIALGKFTVPQAKGLRPGTFRVEINALRSTGKKSRDDVTGEPIDQREQYIPARYNRESTLIAEIKAGQRNQLAFALKEK